jgi:hypothetical protein
MLQTLRRLRETRANAGFFAEGLSLGAGLQTFAPKVGRLRPEGLGRTQVFEK